MTAGVILFAHGSRVEPANEAVRALAAELARRGGFHHVQAAFLDLGHPDLAGAVGHLAAEGVQTITVIPYFLTMGTHLERDLPKLISAARTRFPGVKIHATAPLDGHPRLVDILLDRAIHNR